MINMMPALFSPSPSPPPTLTSAHLPQTDSPGSSRIVEVYTGPPQTASYEAYRTAKQARRDLLDEYVAKAKETYRPTERLVDLEREFDLLFINFEKLSYEDKAKAREEFANKTLIPFLRRQTAETILSLFTEASFKLQLFMVGILLREANHPFVEILRRDPQTNLAWQEAKKALLTARIPGIIQPRAVRAIVVEEATKVLTKKIEAMRSQDVQASLTLQEEVELLLNEIKALTSSKQDDRNRLLAKTTTELFDLTEEHKEEPPVLEERYKKALKQTLKPSASLTNARRALTSGMASPLGFFPAVPSTALEIALLTAHIARALFYHLRAFLINTESNPIKVQTHLAFLETSRLHKQEAFYAVTRLFLSLLALNPLGGFFVVRSMNLVIEEQRARL